MSSLKTKKEEVLDKFDLLSQHGEFETGKHGGGHRPRSPSKTLTECIPADIDCEEDMGLVCGIDEFGLLRTFRSQCQMEFSNCADKT
uniref:Uncharacterized protein n=1 Tax=Timema genevievae TaxID=629358 RepID=A0A7R9JW44_TIMGE|nr:unnamed protein product [Timema genevievae]